MLHKLDKKAVALYAVIVLFFFFFGLKPINTAKIMFLVHIKSRLSKTASRVGQLLLG